MKDIRSCSQLVIRLKIPYYGNVGQKSEKASLKAEGMLTEIGGLVLGGFGKDKSR